MKQIYVQTRYGSFKTVQKSENQCKRPGHRRYRWEVTLTCGMKLDSMGFVFDNRTIEKLVLQESKQMDSCELLTRKIAKRILKDVVNHGCLVHKISVAITPAVTPLFGRMEFVIEL